MFPLAKVAALIARELPRVTPEESGALDPGASAWVRLDGSTAARQMTLAAAEKPGLVIVAEALDVSETVDLDFTNDAGSAVTWTPGSAGVKLVLLSSENGQWTVIAGSAS